MRVKFKWNKATRLILCGIILLLAILIFVVGKMQVDRIQIYDPYKDSFQTQKAYGLTAQLLCPEIRELWLDPNGANERREWTKNTQYFQVGKRSQTYQDGYEIAGKLTYRKDEIQVEYDEDDYDFEIPQSVRPQSFYIDSPAVAEFPKEDGYYNFYYAFEKPMRLDEMYEAIRPFIEEPDFAEGTIGVSWVPIETSSDPAAVTLGIHGRWVTSFLKGSGGFRSTSSVYLNNDYDTDIASFTASLLWLSMNRNDADVALASGIFGENLLIDYQQRLDYIYNNGCRALGIILYSDKRCLDNPAFEKFKLIHYEKDNLTPRGPENLFDLYYDT